MKRLLLALTIFLLLASPVEAIANPDQAFSLGTIYAYSGVLDTGDMVFITDYNIGYSTNPTESASLTFLSNLFFGATIKQTTRPVAFFQNGYGEGLIAYYFSAAEVTTAGMTFTDSYDFVLQGDLSFFALPPTVTGSGITLRSASSTLFHLKNDVVSLMQNLELAWGTVNIIEGTILTNLGAEYLERVLPNARIALPDIFSGSLTEAELLEFENEYTATVNPNENALDASFFGVGMLAISTDFCEAGGAQTCREIIYFVWFIAFWAIFVWQYSKRTTAFQREFPMVLFLILMPLAGRAGFVEWPVVGIVAFVCGMLFVYQLWHRYAS